MLEYDAPSSGKPIDRYDLIVSQAGVSRTLEDAGISAFVREQLDAAFVSRVDLFARAKPGSPLTLWLARGVLLAAKVHLVGRGAPMIVARYDCAGAPPGFYDQHGDGMVGTILARPVALGHITSRFGERFDAFTGELSVHHGIDYGVPIGTPVVAVGRGRVVAVGSSAASGNFVKLAHRDGYESLYLHLSRFASAVHLGAIVDQGQVVALSGNTGRSTGPHLHYELHLAGTPLDPLATLPPPTTALGPRAKHQHLALIEKLEAMR